ncbi:LysR substrate-binding domain-containing protein [Denitrobaculum tricleocarpae]|uniref:LysR substrate-binding domain-containing protein n=1 Tax=Denitrobaculum tricleocarpae TaxID=2591009 RepID=UPI0015D140F2|nr:LysR substrate-binding domain-containing protein [Denitrobaculum tricleocarpae]
MPLDLKELESFVISAETLNFSETAKRRNTVQSAVSSHILKLEELVGQRLFDRKRGQSMRLTAEGEAFVIYARRILNLTDEAIDSIRQSRVQSVIRLGTTSTLAVSVLSGVLEDFALQFPKVRVEVSCDRSAATIRRFDNGDFDLAFITDQGKRPGRLFVENVGLAWVSGPRFSFDPAKSVPLAFLTDGRDLRRFAMNALDNAGQESHIAHTSPDPIGLRALVIANLALTVMPRIAAMAPLKVRSESDGLPSLGRLPISAYQRVGISRKDVEALGRALLSHTLKS